MCGGMGSHPNHGWTGVSTGGTGPLLYDNMKPCSGALRHLLLLCTGQIVQHRTLGVVKNRGSCAILFATAKGTYDMPPKSFSL